MLKYSNNEVLPTYLDYFSEIIAPISRLGRQTDPKRKTFLPYRSQPATILNPETTPALVIVLKQEQIRFFVIKTYKLVL